MSTGWANKSALLDRGMTDVWLGLYFEEPGQPAQELEGPSYRRQGISFELVDGQALVANTEIISFPNLPPVTITHVTVWDQKEGGTLLWSAEVERHMALKSRDTVIFEKGNLQFGALE